MDTNQFITKIIAGVLLSASAFASEPVESGGGKVCAVLKSFSGDIQVFDNSRTSLDESVFGSKLNCGDWISVGKGKATLEHSSGAAMLISENSFVQILDPQSGSNPDRAHIALYRGEFLINSGKVEAKVVTPNAVGRISKGGAFFIYSTATDESQVVGLGGKTTLENRFFGEKSVSAGFAQLVSFSNPVERLIPDQGRPVNAAEFNARLAKIGVEASVRDAVEKTVKASTKTRMPVSLAKMEEFSESPEGATHSVGSRAPASVGTDSHEKDAEHSVHAGKTMKPAAESHAAAHTTVKHVARTPSKKPAVRKIAAANEPDFKLARPVREEEDKKRLIQALSTIRPDEE